MSDPCPCWDHLNVFCDTCADRDKRAALVERLRKGWTIDTPNPCPDRFMLHVPAEGTFLLVDGKVMRAKVDQQGYAGPQVHMIVTDEPWEDDDD